MKQLLRYSSSNQSYEYYSWNNHNLTTLLRNNTDYHMLVRSWIEQREWAIDIPLSALPSSHPIRTEAAREFRAIAPPLSISHLTEGFTRHPLLPRSAFSVNGLNLTFSSLTGALVSLVHTASKHEWASDSHQLGEVLYQTFDEAHSYNTFLQEYISFDMDTPGADQYPPVRFR